MLPVEAISARKFLEAAQNSNDTTVFYGVYKYFQQRNQRARGSTAFLKGIPSLLYLFLLLINSVLYFRWALRCVYPLFPVLIWK